MSMIDADREPDAPLSFFCAHDVDVTAWCVHCEIELIADIAQLRLIA